MADLIFTRMEEQSTSQGKPNMRLAMTVEMVHKGARFPALAFIQQWPSPLPMA